MNRRWRRCLAAMIRSRKFAFFAVIIPAPWQHTAPSERLGHRKDRYRYPKASWVSHHFPFAFSPISTKRGVISATLAVTTFT
jgi:hypothetical protein